MYGKIHTINHEEIIRVKKLIDIEQRLNKIRKKENYNVGRVVIPKEIRETFNIKEKSPIEIYVDKGRIVLEKATITCQFCGSEENLKGFNGKAICTKCLKKLQENKLEKIDC